MIENTVGFIGAGQMARALGGGFVRAGLVNPDKLFASDRSVEALDLFCTEAGGKALTSNIELVQKCDVIFLAVKPQDMNAVLVEIAPKTTGDHLVVSIAAGVTLETLSTLLDRARLVRVMPNTPCLHCSGACGYSLGTSATSADGNVVRQLLEVVGIAVEVKESQLDAVTGLSGSGPAFVYTMIEAMADGGVRMGLSRETSLKLAAQTVLGAADMVIKTEKHPAVLRDAVASPGGTTIAGLQTLEEYSVRAALIAAVEAATERSIELGFRDA